MSDSDAYDRTEEYDATDVDTNPAERGKWVSILVALLGLWLIAAPFVFGVDTGLTEAMGATFWNDVVVGALVFVLGAYSAYEARKTRVARPAGR